MRKLSTLLFLLFAVWTISVAQTSVPRYELITATGTNTYVADINPRPSLQNGFKFAVKFTNANSGASTLNVSTTGAISLHKADGTALSSGDIPAGSDWWVIYDGTATQWRLVGGSGGSAGLVDADYTDITVSGTGTVMTIDNGVVTGSKIASGVALAGSPTTTTQSANTNNTTIATTAYTDTGLALKVNNTGSETIAGVKTFSSDPLIPDEAYAVGWNGSLEPPTKNAVYDKINPIIQFVTPEQYGAVGDGITNDQAAIQSAINSGFPVFFGPKTYLTNTAINFPDGARAFGCGNLTILKTTSNVTIFNIQGQQCSIDDITFQGDSSGSSQRGIAAVGNVGFTLNYIANRVTGCRFVNFGGAGMYATNIIGSSSGTLHEGAFTVDNVTFSGCTNAIFWDVRAEYNIVTNFKIYNCPTGIRNLGGNNSFSQFNITGCTTAWNQGTGANDGHSVAGPGAINHNTTNVSATGVLYGYLFANVMIYSGNINIATSNAIRFNNCEFGLVTTITSTTNTNMAFNNCRFVTNPTFSVTGTLPRFFNNNFETGTIPTGAESNTLSSGGLVINGIGTTSATSDLQINDSGATKLLEMLDDGGLRFGSAGTRPSMFPSSGTSSLSKSGTALSFLSSGAGVGFYFENVSAGFTNTMRLGGTFTQSSGVVSSNSLSLSPTINTTSTYVGDYTGISYNPTLTSVTGLSHYGILIVPSAARNGFGTATPNSTVSVNGSFSTVYVAKTGAYTLTSSDYLIEVTSGTHNQTLPTAVGIAGRTYVITNSGSGTVTVDTTSSQTFANVTATPTTLTLLQFQTATVVSNGANWLKISGL